MQLMCNVLQCITLTYSSPYIDMCTHWHMCQCVHMSIYGLLWPLACIWWDILVCCRGLHNCWVILGWRLHNFLF